MSKLQRFLNDPRYAALDERGKKGALQKFFTAYVATDPRYQQLGTETERASIYNKFLTSAGIKVPTTLSEIMQQSGATLDPGKALPVIRYKDPDSGKTEFGTVRTISFEEDGKEVVIPTIVNGKLLTPQQAIEHYHKTGESFGKYDSIEEADRIARMLHEEHQSRIPEKTRKLAELTAQTERIVATPQAAPKVTLGDRAKVAGIVGIGAVPLAPFVAFATAGIGIKQLITSAFQKHEAKIVKKAEDSGFTEKIIGYHEKSRANAARLSELAKVGLTNTSEYKNLEKENKTLYQTVLQPNNYTDPGEKRVAEEARKVYRTEEVTESMLAKTERLKTVTDPKEKQYLQASINADQASLDVLAGGMTKEQQAAYEAGLAAQDKLGGGRVPYSFLSGTGSILGSMISLGGATVLLPLEYFNDQMGGVMSRFLAPMENSIQNATTALRYYNMGVTQQTGKKIGGKIEDAFTQVFASMPYTIATAINVPAGTAIITADIAVQNLEGAMQNYGSMTAVPDMVIATQAAKTIIESGIESISDATQVGIVKGIVKVQGKNAAKKYLANQMRTSLQTGFQGFGKDLLKGTLIEATEELTQGMSNYALDVISGQREAISVGALAKELGYAALVGGLGGLTFGLLGGGIVRSTNRNAQRGLTNMVKSSGNEDAKALLASRNLINEGKVEEAWQAFQPVMNKATTKGVANQMLRLEIARQMDAFVLAGKLAHPMKDSILLAQREAQMSNPDMVQPDQGEVVNPLDQATEYLGRETAEPVAEEAVIEPEAVKGPETVAAAQPEVSQEVSRETSPTETMPDQERPKPTPLPSAEISQRTDKIIGDHYYPEDIDKALSDPNATPEQIDTELKNVRFAINKLKALKERATTNQDRKAIAKRIKAFGDIQDRLTKRKNTGITEAPQTEQAVSEMLAKDNMETHIIETAPETITQEEPPNDQENQPRIPSEERAGQEPVQAQPEQGSGSQAAKAGGVVQTPQGEEVTPSSAEKTIPEKPIGSFEKTVRNSNTGDYSKETIQVYSLSGPINVRGKISGSNWVVEYTTTTTLGETGFQTQKEYFATKKEAQAFIEKVKMPASAPPVVSTETPPGAEQTEGKKEQEKPSIVEETEIPEEVNPPVQKIPAASETYKVEDFGKPHKPKKPGKYSMAYSFDGYVKDAQGNITNGMSVLIDHKNPPLYVKGTIKNNESINLNDFIEKQHAEAKLVKIDQQPITLPPRTNGEETIGYKQQEGDKVYQYSKEQHDYVATNAKYDSVEIGIGEKDSAVLYFMQKGKAVALLMPIRVEGTQTLEGIVAFRGAEVDEARTILQKYAKLTGKQKETYWRDNPQNWKILKDGNYVEGNTKISERGLRMLAPQEQAQSSDTGIITKVLAKIIEKKTFPFAVKHKDIQDGYLVAHNFDDQRVTIYLKTDMPDGAYSLANRTLLPDPTVEIDKFPSPESPDAMKKRMRKLGDIATLLPTIKEAARFISVDKNRGILRRVNLSYNDGVVTIQSSDGRRVYRRTTAIDLGTDFFSVSLSESMIDALTAAKPANAILYAETGAAMVEFDGNYVRTSILQNIYPDTGKIYVTGGSQTEWEYNAKEARSAIDQLAQYIDKVKQLIVMQFNEEDQTITFIVPEIIKNEVVEQEQKSVTIKAKSSYRSAYNLGNLDLLMPLRTETPGASIGFNYKYLLEFVNLAKDNKVIQYAIDRKSPSLFDNYRQQNSPDPVSSRYSTATLQDVRENFMAARSEKQVVTDQRKITKAIASVIPKRLVESITTTANTSIIKMKNGKVFVVNTQSGLIYEQGKTANGKIEFIRQGDISAIIDIARNFNFGNYTAYHEGFHLAFNLFLSDDERAMLVNAYGSEEAAAIAFGKDAVERTGTVTGRIREIFNKLRVRISLLIHEMTGQTFAQTADNVMDMVRYGAYEGLTADGKALVQAVSAYSGMRGMPSEAEIAEAERQYREVEAKYQVDRKTIVARAKELGLNATGATASLAERIRIITSDPKTWTREDFDKIKSNLAIHQDFKEGSGDRVEAIMRDGVNKGMVDSVGDMDTGNYVTYAKKMAGGDAYIFLYGMLKYRSKDSPYLREGNIPLYHIKTQQGQTVWEAIQTATPHPRTLEYALPEHKEGWLKAPNGQPTNLNERQWVQVRTPLFKAWFGDWENDPKNASKVVDENGEPKPIKHGTPNKFTIFNKDADKNTDAGWLGEGFYFFGNNDRYASQYGDTMELFVNIRNPYIASGKDKSRLAETNTPSASKQFSDNLVNKGYDGVFYNADLDEEWVAFTPTQIKSATANVGTFSENPDIRYSEIEQQIQETEKNVTPAVDKSYTPTKTKKAYKLFETKKTQPGKIFPLFIGKSEPTPIGEWIKAEFIPTKGFQERPGWHLGFLPYAPHLRQKNGGMKESRVWYEVEIPDDVNWQEKADQSPTGDIRGEVPEGGYYTFKRPGAQGGEWKIAGAIKVIRPLSLEEVIEIRQQSDDESIRSDVRYSQLQDAPVEEQIEDKPYADKKIEKKARDNLIAYRKAGEFIRRIKEIDPKDTKRMSKLINEVTAFAKYVLPRITNYEISRIERIIRASARMNTAAGALKLIKTIQSTADHITKRDLIPAMHKLLRDNIAKAPKKDTLKRLKMAGEQNEQLAYIQKVLSMGMDQLQAEKDRILAAHTEIDSRPEADKISLEDTQEAIVEQARLDLQMKLLMMYGGMKYKEADSVVLAYANLLQLVQEGKNAATQQFMEDQRRFLDTTTKMYHLLGLLERIPNKGEIAAKMSRSALYRRIQGLKNTAMDFHTAQVFMETLFNDLDRKGYQNQEFLQSLAEEYTAYLESDVEEFIPEDLEDEEFGEAVAEEEAKREKMQQDLETIEYLLPLIEKYRGDYKGWFHETFMRPIINANRDAYESEVAVHQFIENARQEIYSKTTGKQFKPIEYGLFQRNFRRHRLSITLRNEKGGERLVNSVSMGEIMTAYAHSKNPKLAKTLYNTGYDDVAMAQINKFMESDDVMGKYAKAWVDWTVDVMYPVLYDKYNPHYMKRFGVALPMEQVYTPLYRDVDYTPHEADVLTKMQGFSHISVFARYMISRIPSDLKLDRNRMNFETILLDYVHTMEHFVHYSPVIFDARNTILRRDMKVYLKRLMGEQWLNTLVKFYTSTALDKRLVYTQVKAFERNYNNFMFSVMFGKLIIGLKQIGSIPLYMSFIDGANPAKFAAGLMWATTHPLELSKLMNESVLLKKRYQHGFSVEMFRALHNVNSNVDISQLKAWTQKYLSSTKHGDMFAVLLGGGAVYINQYHKYLSQGMNEIAARQKAIEDMEDATNRSQQSAEVYSVSRLQAGDTALGVLGRLLSSFQSAQAAVYNMVYNWAADLKVEQKSKAESINQAFAMFMYYPLFFAIIAGGFILPDSWDDWIYDLLYYNIGNSMVLGNLLQRFMQYARTGKAPYRQTMIASEETVESLYDVVPALGHIAEDFWSPGGWGELIEAISPAAGIPWRSGEQQISGISDYVNGESDNFARMLGMSQAAIDQQKYGIYKKEE